MNHLLIKEQTGTISDVIKKRLLDETRQIACIVFGQNLKKIMKEDYYV